MPRYLIHTCPQRAHYVSTYLIPSMLKQGVNECDINVYNDIKQEGILEAWLKSCEQLDESIDGTWHLQDDVLICKDFKQRTEELDKGIICGFGSTRFDSMDKVGYKPIANMWWSFPCIRIPNKVAIECAKWIRSDIIGNPVYRTYWEKGAHDDWCFKMFMKTMYPKVVCLNLAPTLVEHIDWLLSGSTWSTRTTDKPVKSLDFTDKDLVMKLSQQLRADKDKAIGRNEVTIGQTVWSSGG